MARISGFRLSDKVIHERGLLSFKGKERPSREIAAVFSFFIMIMLIPDEA